MIVAVMIGREIQRRQEVELGKIHHLLIFGTHWVLQFVLNNLDDACKRRDRWTRYDSSILLLLSSIFKSSVPLVKITLSLLFHPPNNNHTKTIFFFLSLSLSLPSHIHNLVFPSPLNRNSSSPLVDKIPTLLLPLLLSARTSDPTHATTTTTLLHRLIHIP